MQHRDEDSEPNAAEQAFEAIRAEVEAIRQAMKSFPEVIKKSWPADTTETLGTIVKKLETIGHFMAAIEPHPGIRLTPAHYTQAMAAAAEGLMHKAVPEFDNAKADAVAERRELTVMIGTMNGQRRAARVAARDGILCADEVELNNTFSRLSTRSTVKSAAWRRSSIANQGGI